MSDGHGQSIARGFGIFMSGGVWILCATNIREVMRSTGGLRISHIAVTIGFFFGMICYTKLCFAEGRARERSDRERKLAEALSQAEDTRPGKGGSGEVPRASKRYL